MPTYEPMHTKTSITCGRCHTAQPLDRYYPAVAYIGAGYCKACMLAYQRARRAARKAVADS